MNILDDNGNNKDRPSWDVYFFEIADSVSKRATCDRGKSGCVIVMDKQILVTGFVGSPVGFAHCNDVGRRMKRLRYENGQVTEYCMRLKKHLEDVDPLK